MFPKRKVELLQLALTAFDFYRGKIDGIVGPLTLSAVKKVEALYAEFPPIDKPAPQEPAEKPEAVNDTIDGQGADIENSLLFTLKNEGGYVDHRSDAGGATNKGITIGTLSEYLGRPASKEDVKNLDYETIKQIYKKFYWDKLNLDLVVDQSIATALFDMGVLCGTGTAARLCQKVLGIPQTKKMDARTIEAINSTTDQKFIPAFADINIKRFEDIVKNKPSQRVFLRGWKNRANRLKLLATADTIDVSAPVSEPGTPIGEGLHELADAVNVPREDIDKMIDWQTKNHPTSNPRYWAVFKIREHSKNKRMHIFDRILKRVQSVHAVHGTASDPNHDGWATEFSNTPNSHKSSLGLYKTLNEYNGKHGRSLRLDGLETSNSNARKRAIVFHGVSYAGDEWVRRHGRCGRSFGCPAVEYAVVQNLIDKLKGGSLLLIS